MRRAIAIALMVAFASLLALPATVAAQQPALPHQFYGTVKINGTPAPAGTVVIAKVDGVEKGRIVVTTPGKYGGATIVEGKLVVSNVAVAGSQIVFYIDDYLADTPPDGWPGFDSGAITELNLTITIAVPVDGGGGGGGGPGEAPPPEAKEVDPGHWDVSEVITTEGKFTQDVPAKSADKKVTLTIKKGTTATTKAGKPITQISVTPMAEPPAAPPTGAHIIGLVYDIDTGDATFDEPVTLTFTYDPTEIPEGVSEEDLVIALWDEDAGEWVELTCVVDPETNTISAEVTHLSKYAIFSRAITPPGEEEDEIAVVPPVPPTSPAAFTTSALTISPAEVGIGESVTISVLVTNTGGLTGSYEVILTVDNVAVATKDVTLDGGASQTVTFTAAKNAGGTYTVNINGLSGTFTVKAVEAPIPPPPEEPANWGLIGGIIAGCVVVIGLLVYFFVWRRRGAY